MLAFSSQRAGKTQMEGQAYLAIAITLDNMQQYSKAIESYTKFYTVCEKNGRPNHRRSSLQLSGSRFHAAGVPSVRG